jgi:hypothetical protein
MYDGQILWDMDAYMLRPVALGDAAAGAALARFRTRTLSAAQALASNSGFVGLNGRKAALFPTTASMIDGDGAANSVSSTKHQEDFRAVELLLRAAVHSSRSFGCETDFVLCACLHCVTDLLSHALRTPHSQLSIAGIRVLGGGP